MRSQPNKICAPRGDFRGARADAATITAIKEKAFELSINPNAPLKDVKAVMSLILKARDDETAINLAAN